MSRGNLFALTGEVLANSLANDVSRRPVALISDPLDQVTLISTELQAEVHPRLLLLSSQSLWLLSLNL